jgi:undecaprenyl-phosphate 4-deoxy-4-formamido-L-arabinose transferase
VFNSEATLRPLIARIAAALGGYAPLEVILVNDCSHDGSWEVIQDLALEFPWVRGFNLMRNFGQHNALLCGIRLARYAVTVTLDDDLQNPPEEVPRMLEKLGEGYDVVYGSPIRDAHGVLRTAASKITKAALQTAMGAVTAKNVSAFRAFRTPLRDAFRTYSGPYVSIDVLLTWGTTRFSFVRVRNDERSSGVSNYTMGKLLVHALNMMTGFSTLPLQIASFVGFGFILFGAAVLLYVLVRYLMFGSAVPGFPFLASLISIFSGAQLFTLGVMGEYLARIHVRTMDRPSYVLLETTDAD